MYILFPVLLQIADIDSRRTSLPSILNKWTKEFLLGGGGGELSNYHLSFYLIIYLFFHRSFMITK